METDSIILPTKHELQFMIKDAINALNILSALNIVLKSEQHLNSSKIPQRPTNSFIEIEAMAKSISKPTWIKSWQNGNDNSTNWMNFGLILNYYEIKPNIEVCPNIYNWLKKNGDWLVVGLSYLPPNGIITPHVDNEPNQRARTYHLGLLGDENSILSVIIDDKLVEYKHAIPGNLTQFEDSDIHYASNYSQIDRIILYFKK